MRRSLFAVLIISVLSAACATLDGTPKPALSPQAPRAEGASALQEVSFTDSNSPGKTATLGSVMVTDPLAPRTLDLTLRPDDIWVRIRAGFGIPNIQTPLVAEKEAWFLDHQDSLQRSEERSSLYLYHVVEELEKRNMPTELALLPFIESAYNPMAYSRAHASGMWQFIPSTGKNFNLRQDWWHDQRRDVVASTDAALNYLQALYEMYGDWQLALASYNWGEGAVGRAIEHNRALGKPTDYLSLNMPAETRNYLPKLQALKNIILNPIAFGVQLPPIGNQPYFVTVSKTPDMDVRTAAELAEMPLDQFVALNPSFNRALIVGADGTDLLLPADRAMVFQTNLQARTLPLATWQAYTVQRGERLDHIATHFGMTVASLRAVNGLTTRSHIKQGDTLLVQKRSNAPATVSQQVASIAPASAEVATAPVAYTGPRNVSLTRAVRAPSHGSANYTVHSGDTLFGIAKKFGITVEALEHANHLSGHAIAKGQSLMLPTPS